MSLTAAPREELGRNHMSIDTWQIYLCKMHCSARGDFVSVLCYRNEMRTRPGDTGNKSGLGPQSSVSRIRTGRCGLVDVQKLTSSEKAQGRCRTDPGRPLVATWITTPKPA